MQLSFRRTRGSLLAAIAAITLPFVLLSPLAALADDDSPSGSVARISVMTGSVAVQRGDSATPVDAALNAPILPADYITTGADSRAEVQFDGTSMVRLGENVQLRFSRIDPASRELQLAEGTVEVRLLHGADGTTSIDTPSVTVQPKEGGSYRVSVTSDGETRVTVRSGRADIITPQGTQSAVPGSTLVATGTAANPILQSSDAIALDQFDRFNQDRDQLYPQAVAQAPYVNTNIDGVSDLSGYGRWVPDPMYGEVWAPYNVATDWAPYRVGRWAWEDGYGWTWISAEPWGWAPYHYGSWYHSPAYGWAWLPPRPGLFAPPWRPALVAFIGFGGGGGIGLSFGNIGWVPLAPGEPFHPWFGGRTEFVTNISVTHVYRNAMFSGASAVTAEQFRSGSFRQTLAVSPATMRSAHVFNGAVPVVPTGANLRYSDRAVSPQLAARSSAFSQRTFAGNASPSARVPFEQQRTAFASAAHLSAPERGANATHAFSAPSQNGTARGAAGSPWDRFNAARVPASSVRLEPRATSPVAHSASAPARNDAWSRFNNGNGQTTRPAASAARTPYDRTSTSYQRQSRADARATRAPNGGRSSGSSPRPRPERTRR